MIAAIFTALGSAGASVLGWLTGSTLDRILTTVEKKTDNETERQKLRGEVLSEYMRVQAAQLQGKGWWFPLLFIVPLGAWFAAVCIYSVLFCAGCAFPQTWTIAALPNPLDEWAGAIITSLFIGKIGEGIINRWARGK